MRKIDEIIVHCTATPEGKSFTVKDIDAWHKARGWQGIGYHIVVYLDGSEHAGRPIEQIGAHVEGHNTGTIGVVYVGGVAADGKTAKDTRTPAQKAKLVEILQRLLKTYPTIRKISGHRDYANKACPSFDATKEYAYLIKGTPSAGQPDTILKRGDSGPAVAAWRAKLKQSGYAIEASPDVFDQDVEKITRWFQAKRGIEIDGRAGPQTMQEMELFLAGEKPYEAIPAKEPTANDLKVQILEKLADISALIQKL